MCPVRLRVATGLVTSLARQDTVRVLMISDDNFSEVRSMMYEGMMKVSHIMSVCFILLRGAALGIGNELLCGGEGRPSL